MRLKLAISIALIVLPLLFVFKNFFLAGPLAWGDAPHFYPEMLKELIIEPLAWTNRGYSFGGVNIILWLSPIMFLYGLLGNIIGNDLTIRILFYFPSVILAGIGTYFLTTYLKLSRTVQFFAVLVYLLNTYYLLVIDGGQVGVALAYGLFPLALLFLKKLLDSPNIKSFYLSLIFLSLLSASDPRVAVISVLTIVVWSVLELKIKNLVYLIFLGIATLGINMYWIFPLEKNGTFGPLVSTSTNVRWYDPFLLFSPYWPENLFGHIIRPPIYFLAIPILIFAGLLFSRSRQVLTFTFVFLIFAVLSLGIPFIDKIPLGFAFRDSTKFFIPLVLFAGILIGQTAERLQPKFKIFAFFVYIYLLFLVWPALLGKMNFVLSPRLPNNDLEKIYQNLKSDNSFYRSVWFPEKHPLTYETYEHPAVDAVDLTKFWPLASINASEDVFNFLNNQNFVNTFRLLGIKYLILSDNPREISKTPKDQKDWDTIKELIAGNRGLEKVDWSTQVSVYKLKETIYPRFFAVKQLIAVIGSSLMPSAQSLIPTVYFEDGKWDPHILEGKNPNSVALVLNGTDKTDLAMSFLQKYFVAPRDSTKAEWAVYTADQYLKYKYELLIRGVKFTDFDYGKGISFSTKKGEKIEFDFKVPQSGEYFFLTRKMIPSKNQATLKWEIKSLTLSRGVHKEIVENNSDLEIVNAVALVPKKDLDDAKNLADIFTKHFKTIEAKNLNILEDYKPVEMENSGTAKFKFTMPNGYFWLIFSDNYNKLWKLRQGTEYFNSVPVYSMINGFYAEDKWTNIGIEFKGQENVRWGIYWSTVSILALSIIYLWFSSKPQKEV